MSNQLSFLLEQWQACEEDTDWVLGTVYKTEGSAYRKAGAMMMINGLGQQFGLLSGGCLESDIILNARKIMKSDRALTLVYDGSDEDDLSFQLGIGCGGKVYIMLQPLSKGNDLGLSNMADALRRREAGHYFQKIGGTEAYFKTDEHRFLKASVIEDDWLVTPIEPEPHILVIGGGMDAIPVVRMAKEMGWRITLADPRPANARAEYFQSAHTILRAMDQNLTDYVIKQRVDAAIIMTHNIQLDAQSLKSLQPTRLQYIALLGPKHRYQQVLDCAGLKLHELSCPVSGPAGLDIGGQLPESIALSILSECHGVLHQKMAKPELKKVMV